MPHRDVQATQTDYVLSSSQLVNEYLANPSEANEKYLNNQGDSKIFEITGIVNDISEDFNGNTVVVIKSGEDLAGVSCTFSKETNGNAASLKIGNVVSIKGVIRSGASFDSDLNMYENVIMEKCDLISKNK
ncbi:MAG: OB-fold putative lipoprotein [Pedobacter sp.]|nr:OB-fold putative lipoprotein [Pedobacter sp.]